MRWSRNLIRCLLLLWLPTQLAFANGGFSPEFIAQIQKSFYSQGQVSSQQIDAYAQKTRKAQAETIAVLTNYYKVVGKLSPEKAQAKAMEDGNTLAYNRILTLLEKLRAASGSQAIDLAATIIHLDFALQAAVQSRPVWEEVGGYAHGFFKNYKVRYRNQNQAEAFDLVNPTTGNLYTQKELAAIKANGGDISRMDPQGDGSYWTNTDIEHFKVERSYLQESPLFRDAKIAFPKDGANFTYEGPKRSQSRPKIKVSTLIDGKKLNYKLKFVAETHSEGTAAALMSALGYNTDPSHYIRAPKIYFTGASRAEFYRDLQNYYGFWDFRPSIASDGKDAQGEYVILHEAILEATSKDTERLGGWPFNKNGHGDLREVRAMSLFMAWINNNDMKEAGGQNKVLIRESDSPEKVYYVSSDLGYTFGSYAYPESVTWLKWNPIKSTAGDGVSFHFMTWHWADLMDHVTYDDARWMVRRIARLSRQQMADAIALGRWPGNLGKQLLEKLISRRNYMVEAFGLSNEFAPLKADTGVMEGDKPGTGESNTPGDEFGPVPIPDFGYQVWAFLRPALEALNGQLVNATADGRYDQPVRTQLRFGVGSMLGLASPYAHGLIFNVSRTLIKNREPKAVNETFLIHDQIVVGYELGGKLADVKGTATYYRAFNLIHPATDEGSAYLSPNYLGNLLMPFAPGFAKLPPKYSMYIEDYLEGKGTVTFKNQDAIRLETDLSLARVYLKRYLISDKDDGAVNVLEDRSKYTELSAKVYATLGIVGFPVVQAAFRVGRIDRDLWNIPVSGANANVRWGSAIHQLFRNLDVSGVDKIADRHSIHSDYLMSRLRFNLFDLFHSRDAWRQDNLEETTEGSSTVTRSLQITAIHDQAMFNFGGSSFGEQNFARAFFMGVKDDHDRTKFKDTILGLNIKVQDAFTSSRELGNEYIKLCNNAAADDAFIPYSPVLHTERDQWGNLLTQVDFLLYQEGIDALLKASRADLWQAFHTATGILVDPDHRPRPNEENPLVGQFATMIGEIEKASHTADRIQRANILVHMLQNAAIITSMTSGIKGGLLGAIRLVVPEEGLFISAKIGPNFGVANPFPEGKPLVNQLGKLRYADRRLHNFELTSYEQIYNFFDSVIPHDTTTPSTDLPY